MTGDGLTARIKEVLAQPEFIDGADLGYGVKVGWDEGGCLVLGVSIFDALEARESYLVEYRWPPSVRSAVNLHVAVATESLRLDSRGAWPADPLPERLVGMIEQRKERDALLKEHSYLDGEEFRTRLTKALRDAFSSVERGG
jgi:hypothetical protein